MSAAVAGNASCHNCRKPKRVKAQRCPICFETILAAHEAGGIAENALGCQHNHQLCMSCVKHLIEPTKLCSSTCGGFSYRCPMCRTQACLRPTHVLAVLRGGHAAANELVSARFGEQGHQQGQFDTQRVLMRHQPSEDESEDEAEAEPEAETTVVVATD